MPKCASKNFMMVITSFTNEFNYDVVELVAHGKAFLL